MKNSSLIEKVRALVNLVNTSDKFLTLFIKIKNVTNGKVVKTVLLMVKSAKYYHTNNRLILSIYHNHSYDNGNVFKNHTVSLNLEKIFDLYIPNAFLKENWD